MDLTIRTRCSPRRNCSRPSRCRGFPGPGCPVGTVSSRTSWELLTMSRRKTRRERAGGGMHVAAAQTCFDGQCGNSLLGDWAEAGREERHHLIGRVELELQTLLVFRTRACSSLSDEGRARSKEEDEQRPAARAPSAWAGRGAPCQHGCSPGRATAASPTAASEQQQRWVTGLLGPW